MFWLSIAGICLVITIICFVVSRDDYEFAVIGAFFFAVTILIAGIWIACFISWNQKAEEFKIIPITIDNKLTKIAQMRRTYYDPPKGIQFNMDMVNKDLASSINAEIKNLEEYINEQNVAIVTWKISYKYRFWNSCYVKAPIIEPINLSDYKF